MYVVGCVNYSNLKAIGIYVHLTSIVIYSHGTGGSRRAWNGYLIGAGVESSHEKGIGKNRQRKSKFGSDAAAESLFGCAEVISNGLHLHGFQT